MIALSALTVTPAFAGERPLAQRIARIIAPTRVSGSPERGVGLITYDLNGNVRSTTRQRPDGTQVTRERQTYMVNRDLFRAAQLKTVSRPNGMTTKGVHVFGAMRESIPAKDGYTPLTPTRALGKALWASPVTKGAALATALGGVGVPAGLVSALTTAITMPWAIFGQSRKIMSIDAAPSWEHHQVGIE